uniref:Late endosomal/lysosomal adaptor and MAPK and MTOR activator 1 n=1 Tax=Schistocephalus solidus TaxID=70667 RepID=A0A183T2V4_SCHSO
LAALSQKIPNSKQTVEDPSTQISMKVALSSLPIEQVGPVSYVTAYVEPTNQTDSEPSRN